MNFLDKTGLEHLWVQIVSNLSKKVDKEDGKGLSTNDYTDAEKTKLAGIANNANNYDHPIYTARTGVPTANATPAFGGTFNVSQPISDATGHITAINSRTVTIPNTAATTSAAGLMSAADKSKLDGITASADSVSFSANATSGNKVGTITINGTSTDMYSPTQISVSGNAGTATTLATARTLTIGSTGKTFDGSADVSWSLSEIGAAASSHTHSDYLLLSGGALTGGVKPNVTNSINLGTSTNKWKAVYTESLYGNLTGGTNVTEGAFTLKNYAHCPSIDFSSNYVTTNENYTVTKTAQIRNEINYDQSTGINGIRMVFRVYCTTGTNATTVNRYENYALPYTTAGAASSPTYDILTTKTVKSGTELPSTGSNGDIFFLY